jgi:proline iminopeptidase
MRLLLVAALALLGALAAPAAAQPALAPGEHRFAVDGINIWYRVAGKPEGVPVVFLHGGPGEGSQAFQAVGGPELEKTQRIVYLDQRGAGRSNRPKDSRYYSIALLVDDIEALRLRLGVPKIVVLGHSFGTILALEYARRYPDHAAAVVLAAAVPDIPRAIDIQCTRLAKDDPAAYARARKGFGPRAVPRCDSFGAYSGDAQKAYVYRNMFPDPATGERVDALDAQEGLRNTGEMGGAIFAQGLARYRFLGAERLTMPVLVVAGGKDFQAVIEPQRALARALPHGRLLEYPANGHFLFVEDPERFARDVTAFLAGL